MCVGTGMFAFILSDFSFISSRFKTFLVSHRNQVPVGACEVSICYLNSTWLTGGVGEVLLRRSSFPSELSELLLPK